MKKLPVAIILRIFSLIAIGFYVFHMFKLAEFYLLLDQKQISFEQYMDLKASIRGLAFLLPLFFLIDGFYSLIKMKRRKDGTINMREFLLPEFNYDDEREAELTGKAAKASLAVIFIYTIFVLLSYVLFLNTTIPVTFYMIFATVSIPIVGLITYYASYRYYFAK